jgi:RNA polymerase sigma-70 factor (sigma-E family)
VARRRRSGVSFELMTVPPDGAAAASFEDFYRRAWPGTVRLVHLLVGVDAVAEDLAQESFTRLHARWTQIDQPDAYLRRTVVNTCRSWHRARERERARITRAYAGRPTSTELEADDLLALVDSLPYRQRAVLILRYYLDRSELEIAHALGCRPGTVKSLAARALAALREGIER